MRVENVYPDYKDEKEREKSIQEVYTELQLIFYNRSESKNSKAFKSEEQ